MRKNPKDAAAATRAPLHLLPSAGAIAGSLACRDGAKKYGPYNWRDKPISLMEYIGAMERHIARMKDGEDFDDKSGVSHLGHIIATASILVDADAVDTLIDDRPEVQGCATDMLNGIEETLKEMAAADDALDVLEKAASSVPDKLGGPTDPFAMDKLGNPPTYAPEGCLSPHHVHRNNPAGYDNRRIFDALCGEIPLHQTVIHERKAK